MYQHLRLLVCPLFLAWAFGSGLAAGEGPTNPTAAWKRGEVFTVSVTAYPRDPDPAAAAGKGQPPGKELAAATYDTTVVATGPELFGDVSCWRIQTNPLRAPAPFNVQYRFWVGAADGWTRWLQNLKSNQQFKLDPAARVPLVVPPPPGAPVELFPLLDGKTLHFPGSPLSLSISCQAEGEDTVVRAVVRSGEKEEMVVRQKWRPGAKWWSEYERTYRGRRDLTATFRPGPNPPAPPPKPDPSMVLRTDPRLQPVIAFHLRDRPLQDLLDLVGQKTGVQLVMEPSLAASAPGIADFQGSAYAWHILHTAAGQFVVKGSWVKTEAGYELRGSGAVHPRPPEEQTETRAETPAEGFFSRHWLLMLNVLVLAGVCGAMAFRHFRRKPEAGSPDGSRAALRVVQQADSSWDETA